MYLALYRKYRPSTFDEVVGQEHITTSLRNQIKNDTISHAYLFCGTRGTGKTSVAKIFAKSINCENPVNGSACGKCPTCLALSDPSNLDILEIDAASNNRVDEIRELREKVKYPPVNGKYKVYIIDEVHMLTDSAFNALLKTLEEPPKHVVFILATTEVQKLPATILSRCIRFDFKLVGLNDLENLVKRIFTKENIKFEDSAVSLIARLGEGSVRDTLSIADMCVAYTNRDVTYDAVLNAVGAIDKSSLGGLAQHILKGDVKGLLSSLNDVIEKGKNIAQIAKDLASYFRDLAVVKTCDDYNSILKYPSTFADTLKQQADSANTDTILKALKCYSALDNEFRLTTNPRIVLEVASLNLCDEIRNFVSLEQRVENLENKRPQSMSAVAEPRVETVLNNPQAQPTSQTIFGKLLVHLRNNNEMMLMALLGENTQFSLENNVLNLVSHNQQEFNTLSKPDNIKILNDALNEIMSGTRINIQYIEEKKEPTIEDLLREKFGDDIKIKE